MMEKEIQVLQVGEASWEERYQIPEGISWVYVNFEKEGLPKEYQGTTFDVVILEGSFREENLRLLRRVGRPYTFFFTNRLELTHAVKGFLIDKMARKIGEQDIPNFLYAIPYVFYPGQEGTKISIGQMEVQKPYDGDAEYDGNRCIILNLQEETGYRQILFTKYNISLNYYARRGIELWPEYSVTGSVSLQYKIKLFRRGGASELIWSRTVSGKDLERPIVIKSKEAGYLSVQIFARGSGKAEIGPIHYRSSREGLGQFLPGGLRYPSDSDRGEVISYFDPGDRKPPLVVYFSGYRTAEGFEGIGIMRQLGSPVLLLGDPRLEGGGFYLGSPDYEEKLIRVIRNTMEWLHFDSSQLIFSGLSMGTFGAVYYGCTFCPRAVVIGKPLMNLGTVAANERRLRPGGFPTSLDVLRMATGGLEAEHAEQLNGRLWERFDAADFSNTIFSVAYMYQDDYDSGAYQEIVLHLERNGSTIVGKGLEGRHNDNTAGIVNWFMSQLRRILRQEYHREVI